MVSRAGQAFDAWREADAAARAAEKRLQQAWDDYAGGNAAPPSKELIHEVTLLRAHAHQQLTAAIAVIGNDSRVREAPLTERPSSR